MNKRQRRKILKAGYFHPKYKKAFFDECGITTESLKPVCNKIKTRVDEMLTSLIKTAAESCLRSQINT